MAYFLLFIPLTARAQGQPEIQYRTESNFLVHFASFVEWPESAFRGAQAPVELCVFGGADFGNSLVDLAKEVKPKGRSIQVRSVKTLAESRSCHILYIGREDAAGYKNILPGIRDLPVLTVGETADFLDAGGIVNFVFGENLQIDIDADAADRAHLMIRSSLAMMARRVIHGAKTK